MHYAGVAVSKKTVIILGVVLVVLYIVSAAMGKNGCCNAPSRKGIEEFAKNWRKTRRVTKNDIKWPCPSALSCNIQGSKTITIVEVSDDVPRKLSLGTDQKVAIVSRANGRISIATELELDPGKKVDLQFDEEGGRIDLACKSSDPCKITIE